MLENKITFIAEAGVNHNGNIENAIKLIDIAKTAGADFVKFQTFNVKNTVLSNALKANYQIRNTKVQESQYEMLEKLELSQNDFIYLYDYSQKIGIEFISTPFDIESAHFLLSLNLPFIKISSGDLTNYPLLFEIAKTGSKMVISTGMADMREIENAIGVIACGYLGHSVPSMELLKEYTICANSILNKKLAVLHCTTAYPVFIDNINLATIPYLKTKLNLENIGYSDHTTDINTPMFAALVGAKIVEKHFTISRAMKGPDHISSLEPLELKEAVENVKKASTLLGKYQKFMSPEEEENVNIVRKGIYAKIPIKKGEKFTEKNLILKRPFFGKDTINYWSLLDKTAEKDYEEDMEI